MFFQQFLQLLNNLSLLDKVIDFWIIYFFLSLLLSRYLSHFLIRLTNFFYDLQVQFRPTNYLSFKQVVIHKYFFLRLLKIWVLCISRFYLLSIHRINAVFKELHELLLSCLEQSQLIFLKVLIALARVEKGVVVSWSCRWILVPIVVSFNKRLYNLPLLSPRNLQILFRFDFDLGICLIDDTQMPKVFQLLTKTWLVTLLGFLLYILIQLTRITGHLIHKTLLDHVELIFKLFIMNFGFFLIIWAVKLIHFPHILKVSLISSFRNELMISKFLVIRPLILRTIELIVFTLFLLSQGWGGITVIAQLHLLSILPPEFLSPTDIALRLFFADLLAALLYFLAFIHILFHFKIRLFLLIKLGLSQRHLSLGFWKKVVFLGLLLLIPDVLQYFFLLLCFHVHFYSELVCCR